MVRGRQCSTPSRGVQREKQPAAPPAHRQTTIAMAAEGPEGAAAALAAASLGEDWTAPRKSAHAQYYERRVALFEQYKARQAAELAAAKEAAVPIKVVLPDGAGAAGRALRVLAQAGRGAWGGPGPGGAPGGASGGAERRPAAALHARPLASPGPLPTGPLPARLPQ